MPEFIVSLEASCRVKVEAGTIEEAEELAGGKADCEAAYWGVVDVQVVTPMPTLPSVKAESE